MVTILAQEGGGAAGGQLFFLLAMVALFYFLLIRPQRRRMRAQQELQRSVEVGDEIVTTAGILGTVREIDEEGVLTVEISPGTSVRMVKQAVARRLVEETGEGAEGTS